MITHTVFSGTLTKGTSADPVVVKLPGSYNQVYGLLVSTFAATASATGVEADFTPSVDRGTTYIASQEKKITTTPTVSSDTSQTVDEWGEVTSAPFNAVQVVVKNLDADNDATVTLSLIVAINESDAGEEV